MTVAKNFFCQIQLYGSMAMLALRAVQRVDDGVE